MIHHIPESRIIYHLEKEHPLTFKEIRLIHLSFCGFTVDEIARKFLVKRDAIYKQRQHAMEKIGVDTFEGALGWLLERGVFTAAG